MNKIFFILIISCMFLSESFAVEDANSVVATSVGKIIVVNDKVWRYEDDLWNSGGFMASTTIEKEYNDYIAKLPVENRMDFFWSIIMHIELSGSFLEDLYILIYKDCGNQMIDRLDKYLEKSALLKFDGPDQRKARNLKEALLLEMRNTK